MHLNDIKRVYMIGIGGIGMSALARYFLTMGIEVAGYDRAESFLTDALIREGAKIHFTEQPEFVRASYSDPANVLVVYTPAVPGDHKEMHDLRHRGFSILKRSEVLGLIAEDKDCIAIAGTHGKTTISTLVAHMMKYSGIPCNAFLGGISKNYNTNILFSAESKWLVTEADEFDRSFLRLFPEIGLITACDADHLDVYGTRSELKKSFLEFAGQVRPGGKLLIKRGTDLNVHALSNVEPLFYSLEDNRADFYAFNLKLQEGKYHFDLSLQGSGIHGLEMELPGIVNVENAVAAASVGAIIGIPAYQIMDSVKNYQGVKRRFDVQINNKNLVYIDDYAHHPRELDYFISSVKLLFPGRKITGVFQPHLYSRTKDLSKEFGASLSQLDELVLLDIYPARGIPLPGVSSEIIFRNVTLPAKSLCTKNELLNVLGKKDLDVLLTMGAGDIDQFVEPIKSMLEGKHS